MFAYKNLLLMAVVAMSVSACGRSNSPVPPASLVQTQPAAMDETSAASDPPAEAVRYRRATRLAVIQAREPSPDMVALDARLRQSLASTGYQIVQPPSSVPPNLQIYFVAPEISASEITWVVSDSDGDPIGKVVQRRVSTAGNTNLVTVGAAAAAEGIDQIIRNRT